MEDIWWNAPLFQIEGHACMANGGVNWKLVQLLTFLLCKNCHAQHPLEIEDLIGIKFEKVQV